MPIHLYWGDDEAARTRAVEALIAERTDPAWQSINLSRLDGGDPAQAAQALEEARTPPFGGGDRVVLLQRSPFCSQCPAELGQQLETTLELIPDSCHLLLVSPGKPDARLRTTKALQKLVKAGAAFERSFALPAIWDGAGQVELVQRTAAELGLRLEPAAAEALSDAIGSDSARLASELEKLALAIPSGTIPLRAVELLVADRGLGSLFAFADAVIARSGPLAAKHLLRGQLAYMRDNGIPKYVRNAVSHDGGVTWPEVGMEKTIRDSGASVEALVLQSGRWLLVNNDLLKGRHRLVAHVSEDEGATWKYVRDIETAAPEEGSFSYPSLIQAKDRTIHISYSYNRKDTKGETIKHTAFNEEWLLEPAGK